MNHQPLFRRLRTSMVLAMPLLLAFLLCSCNDGLKLNNDTALQVLNEEYRDFCNAPHKTMVSSLTDHNCQEIEIIYANLKSMGLVMVREERYENGEYTVHITSTPKAVKEYNYNAYTSVAVAKLVPREILGISVNEETKTAEVAFIGEYETTPFAVLSHGKDICKPGERFEKTATFIHYDSGWRLKEPEESRFPL